MGPSQARALTHISPRTWRGTVVMSLQGGYDRPGSAGMPTGSGEGSPECPLASEFPTVPAATRQRFLTARDGDAALASSMLREHLAWRAANFPLRDGAPRPCARRHAHPDGDVLHDRQEVCLER